MQHHEEAEDEAWIYDGQEKVPPTVRRVKIAENVTAIPVEAFKEHQELEEIIVSSSVQVIGSEAFSDCTKLKFILYQSLDGEEEEEVGIPPNVKVIDFGAFQWCYLLKRLVLNEGLEVIREGSFAGCESLTQVSIPSTVKVIDCRAFIGCSLLMRPVLNEGLREIGESAFEGCVSLTEVDVPSTVNFIGYAAFRGCKLLKRLGLNGGLEFIADYAFAECESLTEVYFPSTVEDIAEGVFSDCKLLERVVLNEGLERIGESLFGILGYPAFFECDSLSHIRIPQSVNSIVTDTFTGCRSLISIELPEECPFNIELSGCLSLVSLAGPISILFPHEEDRVEFFQKSKLGSLVDSEADLIRKLNRRFDNSPLNKLCYYQSYQSLDDAMAQLRSLMEGSPPLAAPTEMDEFGMTPLHVLSLSQTPNLDMLLAVMDTGKPGQMCYSMDSFGCTPMDYLCLNSKEVIRKTLEIRFEQVLGGLDQFWKTDMLQSIDEAVEWSSRKIEIGKVVRKFQRKEILSLVELCLWKVKIDGVVVTSEQILVADLWKVKIEDVISKKEQILADRQKCRIMSGVDVVIPHVLPFLDSI
eukprot:scaffold1348_cov93-Cylindrotheca_fusiformis.AAC.1